MSEVAGHVYQLRKDVLSVPVENESILLAMDSEKYFGVRGAMRHLLEGLRDGLSLDAMIAMTCATYQVEPAVAHKDLEAMLRKLIDAGLVTRIAG